MFLEFEYDKQMFKARTIYGIFWRYKKWVFLKLEQPRVFLKLRTLIGAF